MVQPLTLFGHAGGPNPWKVAILLDELDVPYKTEFPAREDLHTPVYEKYNPNGRVPTIIDPNNSSLTLWESGAIIQYLVDRYDSSSHRISFPAGSNEQYLANQYLHFQMSGQGPYFGQAVWFLLYHPEKIASAQDRYLNEIKRVTKVLDGILAGNEKQQGGEGKGAWLVGGRCSYADLAFVPWYWVLELLAHLGKPDFFPALRDENPAWARWVDALNARKAVKKNYEEKARLRAEEDAKKNNNKK